MSGVHSLLAPSAAERWARCAGALLMGKGKPQTTSRDAASGTCTHWLAEQLLKTGAPPEQHLGKELEFDGYKFIIEEDRCERVHAYARNLLREPGIRYIEHRLDTTPILGVPLQEGHSDCVTLDPLGSSLIDGVEHQGVISVHDLKDGIGHTVYAKNNLQGLIYCAAALWEFDILAPFTAVRFCIHQPRLNHYDEWTYSRMEIEHFISIIRGPAKLAYDLYHGSVDFDPKVHLNPGEEQCMWCPVRGSCPARAKRIVDMFAILAAKHEIDDATLSDIYVRLDEIEGACRDFRGEALARALNGRTIKGQKLVRGKSSARFWKDEKKAEAALQLLVEDDQLYEPRIIKSPTQIDKGATKKAYATVKGLVGQNPGGLSLVPVEDARPAVELAKFDVLPSSASSGGDVK